MGETAGARPRGRPNELEPALIDLTQRCGSEGVTILEAAALLPHTSSGRRTTRALASAAQRLVDKGILRREQEWFRPEGNPEGVAVRYRYWRRDE
jgi:hypothetical protein